MEAPRCGRRHHIGPALQGIGGEIADVGAHSLLVQRRDHGRIVDHALAGEIEQHRAGFHQRHTLGIDQMAGGIDQRHMQGDEIGVP